ncbi:MAG: DHCW motif cupin fold protein [Chitinophagales bacterium]|nr:DHCW motif cupin fold protein [Chitinophagales bacterium]
MNSGNIPFQTTDWNNIPATQHAGETGIAYRRTLQFGDLQIRRVEYSKNYKADHWCEKGHIVYCVEGEMISELADGQKFVLKKGMSYEVSDDMSSHKSYSENGVTLFIIDGAFLKMRRER